MIRCWWIRRSPRGGGWGGAVGRGSLERRRITWWCAWSVGLLLAVVASPQTALSGSPPPVPVPIIEGGRPANLSLVTRTKIHPAPAACPVGVRRSASSATTNCEPKPVLKAPPAQVTRSFLGGVPDLDLKAPRANEIIVGGHTYSGILVQLVKAKKPLQLLNPAAPAAYGSGWDNLERFPAACGDPALKFLSIAF